MKKEIKEYFTLPSKTEVKEADKNKLAKNLTSSPKNLHRFKAQPNSIK